MVILIGMFYGGYFGLIAGGIGSSLADILLEYSGFAPITFIAKGIEGFIVGGDLCQISCQVKTFSLFLWDNWRLVHGIAILHLRELSNYY
jgi:uncharacterized membrane protein